MSDSKISHDHDHAGHGHHDHSHGHGHDHTHGHGHAHGAAMQFARPQSAVPAFSLLTLSVWQRLAGASALIFVLWLIVLWALK